MIFIILLVSANCGIPEFFEPQDPSTASILKHLDNMTFTKNRDLPRLNIEYFSMKSYMRN